MPDPAGVAPALVVAAQPGLGSVGQAAALGITEIPALLPPARPGKLCLSPLTARANRIPNEARLSTDRER